MRSKDMFWGHFDTTLRVGEWSWRENGATVLAFFGSMVGCNKMEGVALGDGGGLLTVCQ